ncbi:nucleoside phosphorylase [Flavihumibacter petaseus]|nr:nucleoside phosphorylase [Flavihumibacter petaseus]
MIPIASSELIINQRGAIYHLDTRPEEIADTIITVGDPDRVGVVSQHFDKIDYKNQHREFVTHTGWIGNKRLSVVATGIGPDNVDIVLNELDALVNIDFATRQVHSTLKPLTIIRMGTCGSLQADIPVDGFVAGTYGLGLDNLLHYYRQDTTDGDLQLIQAFVTQTQLHSISQPYIAGAAPGLLRHFVEDFHHGITVTCPGFYGPQGRILRLGLQHPELVNRLTGFRFGPHRIANFEMETSAIYGLGKLLGHHCISLNAVVANRVSRTFSSDGQAAVLRLIQKALPVIVTL